MTPSELHTHISDSELGNRLRPSKCKIGFGISHQNALSASVLASNSASLLAISPDACNSLLPSEYAIQTPYISALTLKVLKGLALRGGYCHEPEYFHCIITIFDCHYGLIHLFPSKLL